MFYENLAKFIKWYYNSPILNDWVQTEDNYSLEDIKGTPFVGAIFDEVIVRIPNFPGEFKQGEFDEYEEI